MFFASSKYLAFFSWVGRRKCFRWRDMSVLNWIRKLYCVIQFASLPHANKILSPMKDSIFWIGSCWIVFQKGQLPYLAWDLKMICFQILQRCDKNEYNESNFNHKFWLLKFKLKPFHKNSIMELITRYLQLLISLKFICKIFNDNPSI